MNHPMMKCGHAANGKSPEGAPVCVICYMIGGDGWKEVAPPLDLTGRMAVCSSRYGKEGVHGKVPSSTNLAFFEHRPKESVDLYYCGCSGWD